jgi:hypothetical protein
MAVVIQGGLVARRPRQFAGQHVEESVHPHCLTRLVVAVQHEQVIVEVIGWVSVVWLSKWTATGSARNRQLRIELAVDGHQTLGAPARSPCWVIR